MARLAAAVFEFLVDRKTTGLLLNRQVVERAVVFPTDHLSTFDCADLFESAVLFENLSQRLQLRNVLRPLPFRSSESFFELSFQPFEVEVVFREVVDRAVTFGFDLHVVEFRVHGGGDVTGQRPGSRRPDEQILLRRVDS